MTSDDAVQRRLLALGLLLLAPLCAEYLVGYDTSTGQPWELIAGLLILAPLYGAPALLVREVARRAGIRWPGILAMAAAFGVIQAGVVDQSLFSESYRDIAYWEEMLRPTYLESLGFAASPALTFVVGHAVWSFGIPIALVEALRPARSGLPWLRLPGLVVTLLLYLGAAALVLSDHLQNENEHASGSEITGALVVAALLVCFAATLGRRWPQQVDRSVPRPAIVGVLSLVAALLFNLVPPSWPGVAGGLAVLMVGAVTVARFSGSVRWGAVHVVALVGGALLARAVIGFLVVPLGDVTPFAKYAHNIVFFAGAAVLAVLAQRAAGRVQTRQRSSGPGGVGGS